MQVTNTGKAPRGIWVGREVKYLAPGESRDLDLKDADLEQAKLVEALVIDEPVKAAKKAAE
jgi:hypothetical protein